MNKGLMMDVRNSEWRHVDVVCSSAGDDCFIIDLHDNGNGNSSKYEMSKWHII